MGFFSLAYPFLSKEKLKRTVLYSSEVENQLEKYSKGGKPTLILLPHLCLFETLATSPYFRPQGGKSLGAVYRPNRNHELDRWINKARLKTGVPTLARKAGLLKARDHLRKGNWLVVLFDQNAGIMGTGSVFLDRICSISPLPDLLGKTPELNCFYAFPSAFPFPVTTRDQADLKKQMDLPLPRTPSLPKISCLAPMACPNGCGRTENGKPTTVLTNFFNCRTKRS